jgi:hypothetical protein
MTMDQAEEAACAGRFSLAVPEHMKVDVRSQSIYRTNVKTLPAPEGGIQAYWAARLLALRAQPGISFEGPDALRIFDAQKGINGVWYRGNRAFPNTLTLEAAMEVERGLVLADREAVSGKESVAGQLVTSILKAYVPSTDSGFCVGDGAIQMEPSQNERVQLNLTHVIAPDLEVRFATRAVVEPDLKSYSDVEEERELAASCGGSIVVLREQQRRAAGMDGKEIWISMSVPGEAPSVRFSWHFPGTGGDASRPMINLVGSAPLVEQPVLQDAWDRVLGSLRPIPVT